MAEIYRALMLVKELCEKHNIEEGHSFSHATAVLSHVQNAFRSTPHTLTDEEKIEVELAALLHDVDDHKLFPKNKNFENAREILEKINVLPKRAEKIINMISLVSVSANGNDNFLPTRLQYYLYPRYADRLEALGKIGIERCLLYTKHVGRPLFTQTTPRATTEEELWDIATPERFLLYLRTNYTETYIDHFYDKLLHIGKPEVFEKSGNTYFIEEAKKRHEYIVQYILKFGRTGEV